MVKELFINGVAILPALLLGWPGVLFSSVAAADDGIAPEPDREAQFRRADVDNNRSLSRQEVEDGLPRIIHARFDEIDLNADDHLTPDELRALQERQAQLREERRAQRMRDLKRR
jgi:hypothetical protein